MAKLRGGEDYPIYHGATPETMRLAGDLRHNLTEAEKLLWQELRNKKLGVKFRRQHPYDTIIIDFYSQEANLAIELDGGIHNDPYQKERDKERDFLLKKGGIKVLRFKNSEIEKKMDQVLIKIKKYIP